MQVYVAGYLPIFQRTKNMHALWFTIILEENSSGGCHSSSSINESGLSSLLGLDYYDIYLPFMKKVGLIYTFKHKRFGTMIDLPSIKNGGHNTRSRYMWEDFFAEFELLFIELGYICSRCSGKKSYL
jgi:hypothetical protein